MTTFSDLYYTVWAGWNICGVADLAWALLDYNYRDKQCGKIPKLQFT